MRGGREGKGRKRAAMALTVLVAGYGVLAAWTPASLADPMLASGSTADDGGLGKAPYGGRGEVEMKADGSARPAPDDVTDVKVTDLESVPRAPGSPAPPGPEPTLVGGPAAAQPGEPAAAQPGEPASAQPGEPASAQPVEPASAQPGEPASAQPAEAAPQPVAATDSGSPPATLPIVAEVHEKIETKTPSLLTTQEAVKKKAWETERGGFTPSRFAVQQRLTLKPTTMLVDRASLPRDPHAFLWRVAFDTWRGLESLTDRDSGLPIDNVHFQGRTLTPPSLKIGDYTNITNIGLQLASIAAARRLGFLLDDAAQIQASRLLDTLGQLPTHQGYFFNYYDTTSLEATSSFISFVDTSWLVAGLLITRQAFPELASTVNTLLEPIDFAYFYDKRDDLMSHGYYVNLGSLSTYQYGAFYTEARLGSLIAIGKGDAPVQHWYAMRRAFRPDCVGERCPELHELAYTARDGHRMHVHYFNWGNQRYVPSWGGSMFEALMPSLVLDEAHWSPRSLGPNGAAHAMMQQSYARDTLGYPVWGMSPSMNPDSGHYGEFGVPVLGSHGYSSDIVAPYAAALALAVTPDDATADLMEMARRYDIYGEFGFYDAVNPVTGKVAYSYLALDQAMIFLALANHLSGGYVQELFAADPFVRAALPLLAEERFFD